MSVKDIRNQEEEKFVHFGNFSNKKRERGFFIKADGPKFVARKLRYVRMDKSERG